MNEKSTTTAEPSPAPPAEDDLTQLYEEAKRNGAGTYSGSHIIPLIEALKTAREERDRARDALRDMLVIAEFDRWHCASTAGRQIAFRKAEEALKPVSDRQPEGETK